MHNIAQHGLAPNVKTLTLHNIILAAEEQQTAKVCWLNKNSQRKAHCLFHLQTLSETMPLTVVSTSYFLQWPDRRVFSVSVFPNSNFSLTLYVHLWPISWPLTSTHMNSHNCHCRPCFWTMEGAPRPLQARFQRCWTPHMEIVPPSFPQSCWPKPAIRSHAMCSLSSRETQLCAGGTHTRDQVEWLAFWWPLWQPTDGMSVCFRTERRSLLLRHSSGRLHVVYGAQGCKMFSRPLAPEWLKGSPSTHWDQENNWDFNLISDWALFRGADKFRANLMQPLEKCQLFVCRLAAGHWKTNSSYPILSLFSMLTLDLILFGRTPKINKKYTSCWRSERKRGRRRTWGMGEKHRKGTSFPVTLSYLPSVLYD